MLAKLLVIVLLVAVLGSLGSGLVFVIRDQGKGDRAVRALTVRIGLSLVLFAVLIGLWALGVISPHGVRP